MIKRKSVAVVIVFIQSIYFFAINASVNGPKMNADAESIVTALNRQTKFDYRDIIKSAAILDNIRLIVEQAPEFPELVKPFEELLDVLYKIAKSSNAISKNDALLMHQALARFRFRIIAPARSKSDTTLVFSTDEEVLHNKGQKSAVSTATTSKPETLALINLLDDVCNDLLTMTQPTHIKPITFKDVRAEHPLTVACIIIGGAMLLSLLSIATYRYYDSKKTIKELKECPDEQYFPGDRLKQITSQLSTPLGKPIIDRENQTISLNKLVEHFEKNWGIWGDSRNIPMIVRDQIREIRQQNEKIS